MAESKHIWQFFRAGGFDQVQLSTGADLLALDQLDLKLWVALACPTTGLEFDKATLALIDTDKDGRVRAPELIAAVQWTGSLLKNPDLIVRRVSALPLDAIDDTTPEGKSILASARTILASLGKTGTTEITLEETADTVKIFAQTAFNGDGIIVAEAAEDVAIKAVIADIIATQGGLADRSGKPGIDQAKTDAFFAEAMAFDAWAARAEQDAPTILPLGEATAAAAAALKTVKAKVDDYFGRCQLAAYDPRALGAVNRDEKDYLVFATTNLSLTATEAAGFPLAHVSAGKPLPLLTGINPAWAAAVAALQTAAVKPVLGDLTELTEADWVALVAKLAPYDAWLAAKAGVSVEKLGLPRVRELLAGPAKTALAALIAQDKALETEVAAIANVDRLLHYVRDLHLLCENFVNFKDFYDGGEPAIFQAGTLYLDQRSCTLCLPVEDAARHAIMAGLAGTYLAYVDCVRKGTGEKRSIMAAFTDGDSDNLMVGRNGLFYDRKGKDYDATITKIIDNPISVRQAFWSPFKKLVRLVEDQVAKRAAAADADANAKLAKVAETAANADKAAKEADAKKEEAKKIDVGAVAAMGVAFGALSAAFATIAGYVSGLLDKDFWQICLAVLGLLFIVSGPSMLIAWLKLRKRNLGPILDANGWALNAKAKVNVPFGTSLTGVAKLPPGALAAKVDDRFAEHAPKWPKFLYFGIAVCFVYSLANHYHFAPRWSPQEGSFVIPALHPTNAPVSVPISGNITGSISGSVTNTVPSK